MSVSYLPSHQPRAYRDAVIDALRPTYRTGAPWPDYGARLGFFTEDAATAAFRARTMIMGIKYYTGRNGVNEDYGPVARVEAFWRKGSQHHGLLMFDHTGQLVIQVVHALLGYSGSGSAASELILGELGIPSYLTERAGMEVQNSDYVVVFSRQFHEEVEGIDAVIPYHDVVGRWEYWRVR